MKAYSIFVCRDGLNNVEIISSCFSLSSFSFFERNPIKEIFTFIVRSITPKLNAGIREVITHDKFLIFSYKWNDGISIFMICDTEYPIRSAFCCINEVYVFFGQYLEDNLIINGSQSLNKEIYHYLQKYKDPLVSDAIIESQLKIDKACEALHISLKTFLDRNENLDELLQKSHDLSESSKRLFKTSKKAKKPCCSLQ